MVALVLVAVVASAQPQQPPPAKPAQPGTAKPPQPATAKPPQPAPAQPPPTQPPTAAPGPVKAAPPRRAAPSQVIVRDRSGTPLSDVRVTVSGAAGQDIVTDAAGTASLGMLRDGSYRLRLEHDGFITLERDVTIRATQPSTFEVALNFSPPAPSAPAPPPSEPPTPAEPVVVTVLTPRLSAVPSGPPVFVKLPDFLDKNYIGREPIKESVLACLADSTTRMLQLHEAISEHTHAEMDEVLYIVAGEGTIRARGESSTVSAGALSVIPHGVPHAIERRGRNPLMVLSMLSGAPCPASVPTDRGNR
jgi:hypothetical protein